jgi:hypothetical protein
MLILDNDPLLRPDNLYPIAWAYLRPLGSAAVHADKAKLQLFKYKSCYHSRDDRFKNTIDARTPDVLMELAWPVKEKFGTYLEIDFDFVNKSEKILEYNHISRAPWEKEKSNKNIEEVISKSKK